MAPELDENRGKVILDTKRRLYRRNSRVTLYKLIQTYIDIVGIASYFFIATTLLPA